MSNTILRARTHLVMAIKDIIHPARPEDVQTKIVGYADGFPILEHLASKQLFCFGGPEYVLKYLKAENERRNPAPVAAPNVMATPVPPAAPTPTPTQSESCACGHEHEPGHTCTCGHDHAEEQTQQPEYTNRSFVDILANVPINPEIVSNPEATPEQLVRQVELDGFVYKNIYYPRNYENNSNYYIMWAGEYYGGTISPLTDAVGTALVIGPNCATYYFDPNKTLPEGYRVSGYWFVYTMATAVSLGLVQPIPQPVAVAPNQTASAPEPQPQNTEETKWDANGEIDIVEYTKDLSNTLKAYESDNTVELGKSPLANQFELFDDKQATRADKHFAKNAIPAVENGKDVLDASETIGKALDTINNGGLDAAVKGENQANMYFESQEKAKQRQVAEDFYAKYGRRTAFELMDVAGEDPVMYDVKDLLKKDPNTKKEEEPVQPTQPIDDGHLYTIYTINEAVVAYTAGGGYLNPNDPVNVNLDHMSRSLIDGDIAGYGGYTLGRLNDTIIDMTSKNVFWYVVNEHNQLVKADPRLGKVA